MSNWDLRIDQARNADIFAIARSLGATLKKTGVAAEFEGPCPACGGRDRFSINIQKKVWNCRNCRKGGGPIDLVLHIQEIGFRPAFEWITGEGKRSAPIRVPPPPPPTAPELEGQARLNQLMARAYAREISPVRGSPGEQYLREIRQIDTDAIADVLERTDAIGWHSGVHFYEPEYPKRGDPPHPLHGQRLGCIIGIMTDPVTAKPTGAISRTYLDREGRKIGKAKTLGRPVGIVRLSRDEDVLGGSHIAEGIETALDAMARGWRPMWSTGSANLMASFPVLAGIEALTIFADNDVNGVGLRAAIEAAERWLAAGREVHVYQRETTGDLNDAYREVER
jgi:Toprim domain/Zinc-binding domain of primase-helicase